MADAAGPRPAATLAACGRVLDVYYRAVSGRIAHLIEYEADDDPAQFPDTGTTVRLPRRVDRFSERRANFDWYKVALTHRAGHYQAGTFGFRLDRGPRCLPRLLPAGAVGDPHTTDLEQVFGWFTYRTLAVDVFAIAEDLRVDAAVRRSYPGLRPALAAVVGDELRRRPDPAALPPRTGLLELFVRLSLGARDLPPLPARLHQPARVLRAVAERLHDPAATVEDAAEAAVRAYALVTALPNLAADHRVPQSVADQAVDLDAVDWRLRLPEPDPVRLEGASILDTPVQAVAYRDGLGSRFTRYEVPGPPGQEAIFRLRPARGRADGAGSDDRAGGAGGDEDDRPQGPPEPLPHEHHEYGSDHFHPAEGSLTREGPGDAIYPEWDTHAQRYREAWCRVRERVIPPRGGARFFDETLRAYGRLVPDLVAHLERLAPEGLRPVGRQRDGDELDLDASIEATIDLRAGLEASEAVHVRREPLARDVAVVFLLDVSSSTAERADDPPPDGGAAAAVRRLHGRTYRRIIDVERETAALLMAALQRTGDTYGLYTFSGTGRADVQINVVKDLNEPLSRHVAARLDGLKPVHTTRMGTAVRHGSAKLRAWHAGTKLLVVVSDGRPFDVDYGQEYGEGAELDYAVADTRRALSEATQAGIRPFLLTVDVHGQDYLRDLCADLDYEVLEDVTTLPLRLLTLYQRLRTAPATTARVPA